tara:strand:+ start:1038 stop:2174 length:1137 start_codon:yes stop_codon:yes gene_type:complete
VAKTIFLWTAKVVLFLVLTPLLLWGSAKIHVPTAMGRAAAVDAVNVLATEKLMGRLHVDSVDVLREDHVQVSGFAAYDLDDVEVLHADTAKVDFDLSAIFFENTIRLRNLQGYGLKVVLRDGQNSKVSISDVFDSAKSGGQDTSSGNSRDIDLGWMWAEDATLSVLMASRPLRFHIGQASVKVERHGDNPVEIDIRRANGSMTEPQFLGIGVRFVGAGGRIRPKTAEVVNLNTGVCIGDEPMQARVIYTPGPPKQARIVLDYESGLGFLMSIGFRIGDIISGPLEVDEREIPGDPPSNCEGQDLDERADDDSDEDSESEGSEEGSASGSEDGEESADEQDADQDVDEDTDEDNDENVDERLDDADDQLDEALEAAGGL